MNAYRQEYERWFASDALTLTEKEELLAIRDDEQALLLRFCAPMDFGTAGLRSTMYMGIGCMNRFTVAQTTRALASLILAEGGAARGCVIACDSRNHSEQFARVCASVLAGAGVRVYLFDALRPTPELSFAVRRLGTLAGINITASHNPKEYNGYKAYWEDGAQISPEQASVVSRERATFDVLDTSGIADFDEAVADGRITVLGEDFDREYLDAVLATAIDPTAVPSVAEQLKVVYTPLHGAGYRLVPEVFQKQGLKYLYTVTEQMTPDGNFPTVAKPNPEYAAVFSLGIEIANEVGSDLVIATDPDADRVGVMVRTADGSFVTVTGNQMGALLLDYAIRRRRELGTLPADAFCVKSFVSTDMAYKIAEVNGVKLYDVLTGFKFIGEVIKNYEREGGFGGFLLGFEESYGYLLGTYARDKDAVEASMMILEMTAYYKKKNMTLADALASLYDTYGYYKEDMIDIYMEGVDGIENRRRVMARLTDCPPTALGGVEIVKIGDYAKQTVKDLRTGEVTPTGQGATGALYFTLENGDKIVIRPSGTEPKIKIYILAHGESAAALEEKLALYREDAKAMAAV